MKIARSMPIAAAFGVAIALIAVFPVEAMPIAVPATSKAPSFSVVQVRDHGHHHGHHRRDHRFHGRDDYYDRDDQSGVLFKSFVTGTLFHTR